MTHFYGVENVVIVNILSFCHTGHMWNELHAMARGSTCARLCFRNLNIRKCFGHFLGAADASLHASVYFSACVPQVCHECGKSVEVTKLILFMRKTIVQGILFFCSACSWSGLRVHSPTWPDTRQLICTGISFRSWRGRAIVCRSASTSKVDKNRSH